MDEIDWVLSMQAILNGASIDFDVPIIFAMLVFAC
jgi:hypothetical protein